MRDAQRGNRSETDSQILMRAADESDRRGSRQTFDGQNLSAGGETLTSSATRNTIWPLANAVPGESGHPCATTFGRWRRTTGFGESEDFTETFAPPLQPETSVRMRAEDGSP